MLAPTLAGVMAVLALWASAATPALLVVVALAAVMGRWVWQLGPLEREAFRLRRRSARP